MRWAVALLLCVGCRAEVAPAADLGTDFATTVVDFSVDDGLDFGPADLFCSGVVPEICGNGCDDDKNGYTDADDPACTPQLLGTTSAASMLYRLLLQPMAHSLLLDSNMQQASSFAVADRSLAPGVAFIVAESAASAGLIRRLVLTTDGSKGTYTDFVPNFVTRDVCIFNGEVIVVQRAQNSILHRFKSDGMTELTPSLALPALADGNVMATGCTGGDGRLVVAVHDLAGSPTQFLVYTSLTSAPSMRNVPTDLLSVGIDRCLDLAWTPSGFYGLFIAIADIPTNPNNDPGASTGLLYPFALDGAVGPPIDAGVLHGLGTFLP
jgi:hypothetical protein